MARRVFFSFHYENDISRAMVVRNSWVIKGVEGAGFIDKAAFEEIEREGDRAVHNWINSQLEGTSVTVVLIGADTLERPFVQYEICQSLNRGNAVIGVHISGIRDIRTQRTSVRGNPQTVIGCNSNGQQLYFDAIADGIYDYTTDNGYDNLGAWIEAAARKHGK